jgi:Lrp/AsnC family transcriptional regulator for asnA, asnC and gidA
MNPLDPVPVGRRSLGHRAEGLDDIDYRIIALLRRDGRMPFRSIAQELELTEATVRSRVRRMEDSNSMRVVAVTDIEAAGFGMLLAIGVEVEGQPPSVVAERLAEIGEVFSVSVVIGSHDIEVLAVARDQDQLDQLLGRLAVVAGVRRLLPSLAVNVLKNQPHWVPFSNDLRRDELCGNSPASGDLRSDDVNSEEKP